MTKIKVQLNPDTPPTGSDLSVVNAARRSFGKRSDWDYFTKGEVTGAGYLVEYVKLKEKDKRLLEFLARGMTADDFEAFAEDVSVCNMDKYGYAAAGHNDEELKRLLWQWRNTPTHDTPFNHGFISFEVKAPIFVRAQLVKHEYLIMSEFSRRYITDDVEFYEPDYWRKAAPNKKQGSLEEPVHEGLYMEYQYDDAKQEVLDRYRRMLAQGVAPEQARMALPQSLMTAWTWSGTLGAFAKMCQLRCHPEAQYEARIVADEVYKHLKDYWPVAAPALVEGV